MAERQRITKRLVDSLAPRDREFIVWDTDVRRFGIRVRCTGSKFYVLRFRIGGHQRWVTIGEHGDPWTPDTAREEGLRLIGLKAAGKDPAAERDTGKTMPTLEEFSKRYVDEYAEPHKKLRSLAEDRGNLRRVILPALGRLRLDRITRADVTRFHLSRKDRPTNANRCLALLSHLFTMAEKWGLRSQGTNPCRHVERFRETKRERFLSDVELARLGSALVEAEKLGEAGKEGGESPFAVAAVRFALFTGARASEVLSLTWPAVGLGTGTVRLTDSKTGVKTLYLNPPALDVLKRLPRVAENPHVIVGGRKDKALTLSGLEQVWQRIRTRARLEDVRLHDLRHSFASVAAAAGNSLLIIGTLLGHAQSATTQRYAHLSADPLRAASSRIGRRIAAAMKNSRNSGRARPLHRPRGLR
jgi:integrase